MIAKRKLRESLQAVGGDPNSIPCVDNRTERLLLHTEIERNKLTKVTCYYLSLLTYKIQTEIIDTTRERLGQKLHSNQSLTRAEVFYFFTSFLTH